MATGTTDSIRVSAIVPASPERVYRAWLDSREHSGITRSTATVEAWVGGRHSAWGGSIRGTTLELQPNRRIVQSWYASDFPPGSEDSRLEVLFEPAEGGTLVTINHTGLPLGRGHRYEEGWKDFYLDRMKEYFTSHPEPPAEESPVSISPIGTMEPSAGRAISRPAARKPSKPVAKQSARPKRPKAKKVTKRPARKPARKLARKPAARRAKSKARSKPVRAARKTVRKISRPRAKAGRAKARRSR